MSHHGQVIAGVLLGASVVFPVLPATARSAPQAETLCVAPEQTLFSCPIGRKVVSICRQRDRAVYRFGRPSRVQLETANLSYAETAFAGGGESQIIAEHDGTRYIVFDALKRTAFGSEGRHDPEATSGLLVRRGGSTILDARCGGTEDATINPDAAKVLPKGAFVPH